MSRMKRREGMTVTVATKGSPRYCHTIVKPDGVEEVHEKGCGHLPSLLASRDEAPYRREEA